MRTTDKIYYVMHTSTPRISFLKNDNGGVVKKKLVLTKSSIIEAPNSKKHCGWAKGSRRF